MQSSAGTCFNFKLQPDETIVWHGTQAPARFVTGYLLHGLIPLVLMLMMAAFVISTKNELNWFEFSRWSNFHWGVAFVSLIGPVGLLEAFLAFKMQKCSKYIVTNQRAVTISGKNGNIATSYLPHQLTNMKRFEYANGTGDIEFDRTSVRDASGEVIYIELHGFYGVVDAKRAEYFLRKLRK